MLTYFQHTLYGSAFISQVLYPHYAGYVFGELRNRVLVINNADRNASASEASSNSESRVFAADDDCTYLLGVHWHLAGGVSMAAVGIIGDLSKGGKPAPERRTPYPRQNTAKARSSGLP